MTGTVESSVEGGIGRIRFNRPKALNAIDRATAEAFRDAVHQVTDDASVKCIVLSGEGRAFVAGGDLAAFHAAEDKVQVADALIEPLHDALRHLAEVPVITIAAVHAAAAGAGLSLALAADLCLAGESATFTTAYMGVAAPADCGMTWALPRVVGERKAMELMLLSPRLSAEEAERLGIVTRVVPDADLEAETDAMAARLANGPRQAMASVKRLLRAPKDSYAAHLDAERDSFREAAAGPDFAAALARFFDKS